MDFLIKKLGVQSNAVHYTNPANKSKQQLVKHWIRQLLGLLVWNWAFDKEFVQVLTELPFRPGGEHSFEVVWDCISNGGEPVSDGIYRIIGVVPGYPDLPIRSVGVVVGPTEPPPPPVRLILDLEVEPIAGPVGTERLLRFTIGNRSEDRVTLNYPDNQHYDFHVDDPRRLAPAPLWSWSFGKGFTDMPTTLMIPPRQRVLFEEHWPGTTNEGEVVGPGVYHVQAVLMSHGPLRCSRTRIQVTER